MIWRIFFSVRVNSSFFHTFCIHWWNKLLWKILLHSSVWHHVCNPFYLLPFFLLFFDMKHPSSCQLKRRFYKIWSQFIWIFAIVHRMPVVHQKHLHSSCQIRFAFERFCHGIDLVLIKYHLVTWRWSSLWECLNADDPYF